MDPVINLRKEENSESQSFEKGELSWTADYSILVSETWRKVTIIILFAALILLIVFRASIFSIILFGLILVVFFIRIRFFRPKVRISVKNTGLKMGERLMPYRDLDSFWVMYEPDDIQELSIKQKGWYLPHIKIPIYGQDPVQIRSLLLEYIPESEHGDNFIDAIGRKLGI